MAAINISNKRRTAEIGAVVLTATGKFIFMDWLGWRFPFIAAAIIFWVGYLIYRSRTKPAILQCWAFRTDNFWSVTKKVLPFGLLAVVHYPMYWDYFMDAWVGYFITLFSDVTLRSKRSDALPEGSLSRHPSHYVFPIPLRLWPASVKCPYRFAPGGLVHGHVFFK